MKTVKEELLLLFTSWLLCHPYVIADTFTKTRLQYELELCCIEILELAKCCPFCSNSHSFHFFTFALREPLLLFLFNYTCTHTLAPNILVQFRSVCPHIYRSKYGIVHLFACIPYRMALCPASVHATELSQQKKEIKNINKWYQLFVWTESMDSANICNIARLLWQLGKGHAPCCHNCHCSCRIVYMCVLAFIWYFALTKRL